MRLRKGGMCGGGGGQTPPVILPSFITVELNHKILILHFETVIVELINLQYRHLVGEHSSILDVSFWVRRSVSFPRNPSFWLPHKDSWLLLQTEWKIKETY